MAIAILGQVVGAAKGVLHLVDNQEQQVSHPTSPQQLGLQPLYATPPAHQPTREQAKVDTLLLWLKQ